MKTCKGWIMIELREDALIDSFKKELADIKFIDSSDYENIERRLDIIIDNKEERTSKAEAAKWIWRLFFKKSLSSITNNLRGSHEICTYFEHYVDYENLLFAIDKNHRDHTIHTFWVMLLGLFLRKKYGRFFVPDWGEVIANLCSPPSKAKAMVEKTKDLLKTWEIALWCLIAITHDLGYPIQKTRNANETMADMIKNFGFLRQQDFDYNFTIIHQTAIEELLRIISSVVVWHAPRQYAVICSPGSRVDYSKSFERLDHGIMSAYLLLMHIDFLCESMFVWEGIPKPPLSDPKEAARTASVILWLRAISAHTNKFVYWDKLNEMAALLCLSDELEEFSRYSCPEGIYNWINVGCRTEFECTKNSVKLIFTFDKKEIGDDIEPFFKDKIDRLWNRIELTDEGINRISITCKDVRKAEPFVFTYSKDKVISKEPTEFVQKQPGKSSTDIQGFLDGGVKL